MKAFAGFELARRDGRYLYLQIERGGERCHGTRAGIVWEVYRSGISCWSEFSCYESFNQLLGSVPWFWNGSIATVESSDWSMGGI